TGKRGCQISVFQRVSVNGQHPVQVVEGGGVAPVAGSQAFLVNQCNTLAGHVGQVHFPELTFCQVEADLAIGIVAQCGDAVTGCGGVNVQVGTTGQHGDFSQVCQQWQCL